MVIPASDRVKIKLSRLGTWVIRPRPRPGAIVRLFCLPWAGAGASSYGAWAEALPDTIELCAIQLPGRENRLREAPFVRMAELVDTLATALDGELLSASALFGHSLGGLIAFELARRLTADGIPPAHLFIAGCAAPHFRRLRQPMHRLDDAALLGALRRFDGLPEWVLSQPELLDLVLPTLRADLEMFETYEYQREQPLTCALTAFGGIDDRAVLPMEVAGWERLTEGPFVLRLLPGSHFFIGPQRPVVLEAVTGALAPLLRK